MSNILFLQKRYNQHKRRYLMIVLYCIVRVYPPFTRKRIVSLYFGRDIRTGLEAAISDVSGPSVFHIKLGAFR